MDSISNLIFGLFEATVFLFSEKEPRIVLVLATAEVW